MLNLNNPISIETNDSNIFLNTDSILQNNYLMYFLGTFYSKGFLDKEDRLHITVSSSFTKRHINNVKSVINYLHFSSKDVAVIKQRSKYVIRWRNKSLSTYLRELGYIKSKSNLYNKKAPFLPFMHSLAFISGYTLILQKDDTFNSSLLLSSFSNSFLSHLILSINNQILQTDSKINPKFLTYNQATRKYSITLQRKTSQQISKVLRGFIMQYISKIHLSNQDYLDVQVDSIIKD